MNRKLGLVGSLALFAFSFAAGCGGRPNSWDIPPIVTQTTALSGSVALVDEATHTVNFLTAPSAFELAVNRAPVGIGVSMAVASPKGERLYTLSRGVQPRRSAADQKPSLSVFDGQGSGALINSYSLSDPLGGLAIDPEGQFAVVYSSGTTGSFVENPNELIIVDLSKPQSADNPISRTLRSFGGLPQRITFSPQLTLPGGSRRLLIVETDVDVSLLDLEHLDREEITVRLTNGTTTARVEPAAITIDPGGVTVGDYAKIAIRTKQEPSVIVLTLGPLPASDVGKAPNDYRPVVNLVGLNSVPSDIAFVKTDAGPRLAALQPLARKATLIDTATTVSSNVDMPSDYGKLSLVTKLVTDSPSTGSDVALLWGGPSSKYAGVAFWSLGKSVDQAYRSIETLSDVGNAVKEVIDIPAPHASLKLLIPSNLSGSEPIHLLDLASRTASPLVTSGNNLKVTVAQDGQRIWLYEQGFTHAAVVSLTNYHPRNLALAQSITQLFDISNQQGGRTMIALNNSGNSAATLFDALAPDEATGKMYVGILQGGF